MYFRLPEVQNLHHTPGRNTGKPLLVDSDQVGKHFVPPAGNSEHSQVSRQKSMAVLQTFPGVDGAFTGIKCGD